MGAGYVGLSTALGFSNLGHQVICLDSNPDRIRDLNNGLVPIYEPLMEELLRESLALKRLSFTTNASLAYAETEFIFICVQTPASAIGKADLSYLEAAIETLKDYYYSGQVVVLKSTVPFGTASYLARVYPEIMFVSNPEFLREGFAIYDFMNPARIVIGGGSKTAVEGVAKLYRSISAPILSTDWATAEIIKYSANTLLASRISFVNEIAQICDHFGGSMSVVRDALALDPRIGEMFLAPGPGWGGSCFPKDVLELQNMVASAGLDLPIIQAINRSNENTINGITRYILKLVNECVRGKRVGILGLAFKAGTDDVRDSPSVKIAESLVEEGIQVFAFDPKVKSIPLTDNTLFTLLEEGMQVIDNCDVLVALTEWPEFRNLTPEISHVGGMSVLDARGILDESKWKSAGADFHRFGEGSSHEIQ